LWSTQTTGCTDDLERFNRVHARWALQGLQLLTINCDADQSGGSPARAHHSQLAFPVLRGSADIAAIYNIL
jgi:hypothetical protein